jgi:hypothetical protein
MLGGGGAVAADAAERKVVRVFELKTENSHYTLQTPCSPRDLLAQGGLAGLLEQGAILDADDPKGAELTVWRSYNDALFFAGRGARAEAMRSVRRALEVAPTALELRGLREALSAPGEGPVDVRGFVVGGRSP